MGKHYNTLGNLRQNAVDWHVKAVLNEDIPFESIGARAVDVEKRAKQHGIVVIHPTEYTDDLREFFACESADVDEIERLHKEHLLKAGSSRGPQPHRSR